MAIRPEEISTVIRQQIESFSAPADIAEVGEGIQVGDGIARVYGVDNVMSMELLEFPNSVYGVALNLEENNVGTMLLGDETLIKEGDQVGFNYDSEGSVISIWLLR